MKAAVFFDIDGTLWDDNCIIPKSTREAIRLLKEAGHLAFICTGRSRALVNDESLLSLGFSGLVCACGSYIELENEVVYNRLFSREETIELYELLSEYDFVPILEGPENMYITEALFPPQNPFFKLIKAGCGDRLLDIKENYGQWVINKVSCGARVSMEAYRTCIAKVKEKYDVIEREREFCEIVAKGVSKATGMLKACQLAGIDPANSYAFGDSENDLKMIQQAAHGICMGNGRPAAMEVADYITDAIDNDGIYNGLKHFSLI